MILNRLFGEHPNGREQWSLKELLLISRIWNNAVHMEWYFKDISHCDSTLVALRNFARCMYSIHVGEYSGRFRSRSQSILRNIISLDSEYYLNPLPQSLCIQPCM